MIKELSQRRPQKTKQALKAVLVDLLQTRQLQTISIKEITDMANISRGTFYLHYRDIFALYLAVETDIVEKINEIIHSQIPVINDDELEKIIASIFEYLTLHIKECDALLRTDSASLLSAIFERNRPQVLETWETAFGTDEHAMAYFYIFLSHGFAGILKHWMAFGKVETPREIINVVKRLLNFIFSGNIHQDTDKNLDPLIKNAD